MIVAFSAENPEPDSLISTDFGRSGYFILLDTGIDSREVVQNPYAESLGDAGIQSARMLIEKNVDAVVIGEIGRFALKLLSAMGIRVCSYPGRRVNEAIDRLLEKGPDVFPDAAVVKQRRCTCRGRRRRERRGD